MGRRVLIGVASLLAFLSVANAEPTAGQGGSVAVTSNGARLGDAEVLEFPAANYSPSRSGNVVSVPASSAMTALGSFIGDATNEIYQGTAVPATCDVGMVYMETDQPVPSTSADVCWLYVCTATNTWECLGDVNSGGRTGGQTITGAAAADGNLTLKSTANADMGTISLGDTPSDDTEYAMTWAPTFGDNTGFGTKQPTMLYFNPTVTNDQTIGSSPRGLFCGGSITNTASSVATPACMASGWTLASTTGALPAGPSFSDTAIYSQAAAATTTLARQVYLGPTYGTTGAVASTITTAVGADFLPTITTDNAGGTQTVTNLIGFRVSDDTNSGAGTETVSTYVGFDVADLSPANSGTAIAFRNQGTDDQNRLAGKTIMGSGGISTAPSARLEVWESTDKNEVARFRTTATNDDPTYKILQTRATVTASSTTNADLDLTAAAPTDAPCPSNTVCIVEVHTVCHCTSGSACTSQQGAANITSWAVKNNGGTISQIGATGSGNVLNVNDSAVITSLTLSVSSPSIRMAIVAPANAADTCHITYFIQPVGT